MIQKITGYLKAVLAIALIAGVILSANSRTESYDITQLAEIVAAHHAEIEEHGHVHEAVIDVMHAYLEHAHDVADHDHNIAFLPPRASTTILPTMRTSWTLAGYAMPDRKDFDLDRPPRL
jgi:hypothetical protein